MTAPKTSQDRLRRLEIGMPCQRRRFWPSSHLGVGFALDSGSLRQASSSGAREPWKEARCSIFREPSTYNAKAANSTVVLHPVKVVLNLQTRHQWSGPTG